MSDQISSDELKPSSDSTAGSLGSNPLSAEELEAIEKEVQEKDAPSEIQQLKAWVQSKHLQNSSDIVVPRRLMDKIVGQDKAVAVARRLLYRRRNLLLIGEPGTGKSMLGRALKEELNQNKELQNAFIQQNKGPMDVLSLYNPKDENNPKIKCVPAQEADKFLEQWTKDFYSVQEEAQRVAMRERAKQQEEAQKAQKKVSPGFSLVEILQIIMNVLLFAMMLIPAIFLFLWIQGGGPTVIDLFFLEAQLCLAYVFAAMVQNSQSMIGNFSMFSHETNVSSLPTDQQLRLTRPYKVIARDSKDIPFVDATGASVTMLLGSITHDPMDTGIFASPRHSRLTPGAIHRASGGILYIDEISRLPNHCQVSLLTAMEDRQYPIRVSEFNYGSAGQGIVTDPIPSDFILIAAGNLSTINSQELHPALRSRLLGSGYEILMESTIKDTEHSRMQMLQFMQEEISKENLPPLDPEAMILILEEAKARSDYRDRFTLLLRSFAGVIRASADIAMQQNAEITTAEDVRKGLKVNIPIEAQMVQKYIERQREVQYVQTSGILIGRVNGLVVFAPGGGISIGNEGGMAQAIDANAIESTNRTADNQIVISEQFGPIARDSVKFCQSFLDASGLLQNKRFLMTVQFLGAYTPVEGDSASIAMLLSVISAIYKVPVRQDIAITGSCDTHGNVLPVGGIGSKITGAYRMGIRTVMIPESNLQNNTIGWEVEENTTVVPYRTIEEAIRQVYVDGSEKQQILDVLANYRKG